MNKYDSGNNYASLHKKTQKENSSFSHPHSDNVLETCVNYDSASNEINSSEVVASPQILLSDTEHNSTHLTSKLQFRF